MSMPCVGIDGCGTALQAMGVEFKANNVLDLEHRYGKYLEEHLQQRNIYVGKKNGDVTSLKFSKVERPVDFMVSGPPCPPWAGNGCKQGTDDTRSHVFLAVVKLAIALIKCGELKAIILENVRGICHKQKGQDTSFMGILLEFLRKEVAEFHWEVCQLQASDYLLPQQRCRVFLRGLRASIGKVPDPLPAFGHQELANILNPKLPSVDWKSLTPTMANNLKEGLEVLRGMLDDGKATATDIFVFPLDRAEGKVYKRSFTKNIVPTLTTTNKYLFVVSMDLDKGEKQRKYFRFLDPSEPFLHLFYISNVFNIPYEVFERKRHPKNIETFYMSQKNWDTGTYSREGCMGENTH